MQKRIENTIEQVDNEPFLDQFTFSDDEFQHLKFEDDGHEIMLNGKLYDIIKIKTIGSKKVIYCINDSKETALKNLVRKNNRERTKKNSNAFSKIYTFPPTPGMENFIDLAGEKKYLSKEDIVSSFKEIIKPPPRQLLPFTIG